MTRTHWWLILLGLLFLAYGARADCFTVRERATAIAVATETQPGGLRALDPGAKVCTAATAARIRDEIAELQEIARVALADAALALEELTAARIRHVADTQAHAARVAALEAQEIPACEDWRRRGEGAGAMAVVMLLIRGMTW